MQPLRIFIGFDSREPLALEVCAHSINSRASAPVCFIPLNVNHLKGIYTRGANGTTAFSLTRFLTPYLSNYEGVSIFMDCDFLVRCDIFEVLKHCPGFREAEEKSVYVCQHDYTPKDGAKATGVQSVYPRKNWSSFVVFDNNYCRELSLRYVNTASPADLHRFAWLEDAEVGALPLDFNWLVGEYPPNPDARILHFTLGTPCFSAYKNSDHADLWFEELASMNTPLEHWIRSDEQFAVARAAGYPVPPRSHYPLGNPTA